METYALEDGVISGLITGVFGSFNGEILSVAAVGLGIGVLIWGIPKMWKFGKKAAN